MSQDRCGGRRLGAQLRSGMLHRVRRAAVLVAAAVSVAVPVAAATPAAAIAATPPVMEIVTVPALPDVTFLIDGVRHTSDSQGLVRVSLDPKVRRHALAIADKKVQRKEGDYTFTRWWYQGHHDEDF